MRWLNFLILLIVLLVLQVGVVRFFGLGAHRISPDLLLMSAMVIAFKAKEEQAPLACWLLGLAKDMSSSAALGSYAFAYGLTAIILLFLRDSFYGDHPVLVILLTFFFGLAAEHLVLGLSALRGSTNGLGYGKWLGLILLQLCLTAALAPYGYWLLMKLHRFLGLPTRRHYRR